MGRLIDADELKEKLSKAGWYDLYDEDKTIDCIDKMPTIDPVKHGEWVENNNLETVCSHCKSTAYLDNYNLGYVLFDYCSNCGAKMDGGSE